MQQITSRTKWRSSRNVLQAASNSFERTPQSAVRVLFSTSALAVAKQQSDEETSDRLDGQDASCPLSVDGEAVPGGEQAPTQGRPSALTLTCPLCERGSSQTVFINKTTGGLVCPPCKVHGELVRLGGPSGAVRGRGSNV